MELLLIALLLAASGKKSSGGGSTTPDAPREAKPKPPPIERDKGKQIEDQLIKAGVGLGLTVATGVATKAVTAAVTAAGTAGAGGLAPAATVGLGLAYVAGQAAIGGMITGDPLGAAAGATFISASSPLISPGNIGNIGRVIGRELNKWLFGTDGNGLGGTAAQVTGFLGGLLIASYGLTVIPIVGQVFALVLGIFGFIEDEERKKYGQLGALKDLQATAEGFFWQSRATNRAAVLKAVQAVDGRTDLTGDEERAISAATAVITRGWIMEENDTRRRAWMTRGYPAGVTNDNGLYDHGFVRGVFVGSQNLPVLDEHLHLLAALFQRPTPEILALFKYDGVLVQMGKTNMAAVSVGKLEDGSMAGAMLIRLGQFLANLNHYLLASVAPGELFQSAAGKMAGALAHGAFFGQLDADANLIVAGPVGGTVKCDWMASAGLGKPSLGPA